MGAFFIYDKKNFFDRRVCRQNIDITLLYGRHDDQ
jgi:hypothetical protein